MIPEFPNTTDDLDDLVGVELPGTRPGWRFHLVRRLGGGAQGNAFLATRRTEQGDDPVVVKVWRPSFVLAHAEIAALVLKKEYVALARLNDRVPPTPFVVRLLDGAEISVRMRFASVTLPWLALEYVHGGALGTNLAERVRESVKTNGAAPPAGRIRRLLSGIVEGLSAIHEVGVVHRDLKPSNVLVCGVGDDELAKVADFGLSRPMGMASTFGELAVGTPGYAAPEQMDAAKVGPWSDVFSLAALTYFVVSGEDMFEGTPTVKMANVYSGNFNPLSTRPNVDKEWTKGSLARIDTVLRRATRRELSARIPNVVDYWGLLEPLLRETEGTSPSLAMGSARTLKAAIGSPWQFHVMHREPQPLGISCVAFDPDGHGLAASNRGLVYWEGTRWIDVPPPQGVDVAGLRHLRRLGPRRWIGCGAAGGVYVMSADRCLVKQQLDPVVTFEASSVISERHFALAGTRPGSPPVLIACLDGAWTMPAFVEFAERITALAPAGGTVGEWHVTGVDAAGRGVFATWKAEAGTVQRWPVDCGALLSAVTDSNGSTFAVGAGGFAYKKREGHPVLERVFSHRDMTALAVDPAGSAWAASVGRILWRAPKDAGDWTPLWTDNAWTSPFVSIAALAGLVIAAARDGSIVVGHQGLPT